MLDNLRGDNNSPYFQDEQAPARGETGKLALPSVGGGGGKFLGMTALQRFVIAVLLFLVVCIVGGMFLLITGSVFLPFS